MRAMDLIHVQSILLKAVAYDSHRNWLELHFRDGTVYRYLGVPAKMHRDLLTAGSKGAYFNRAIRGHFPYLALPSLS